MEENIKTNVNGEAGLSDMNSMNKKSGNDSKKDDKKKSSGLISKYKAEFKKITWPTRDDLIKQTITVIIVSLLVGVIIFCMDFVLKAGVSYLAGVFY